jgi:hypothetical protein
MCATVSWGAHESFIHPIFVLKNGCDTSLVMNLEMLLVLSSITTKITLDMNLLFHVTKKNIKIRMGRIILQADR